MDRGAGRAAAQGITELDTSERLNTCMWGVSSLFLCAVCFLWSWVFRAAAVLCLSVRVFGSILFGVYSLCGLCKIMSFAR